MRRWPPVRRAPVLGPERWELANYVLLCTCPVARIAAGQAGACVCGYPVVALMAPRLQAKMDDRWPEWRTQVVIGADGRMLAPA